MARIGDAIHCSRKYCLNYVMTKERFDFAWIKLTTNMDMKGLEEEHYFCSAYCAQVWMESTIKMAYF